MLEFLSYQIRLVRDEVDVVQLDCRVFRVHYKRVFEASVAFRNLFEKRRLNVEIRVNLEL